jgi:AcrR family transcriptional regulator
MSGDEDWELWAPFLALRHRDRQAERLAAHAEQDTRRGQRHTPRRADALSRDQIVRTAIAVADAEGADAISMRRIARELHAGTMSLYWHVASKEELLDLVIDSVQGEHLMPEPSGDWRRDMREMAYSTRASLHRHRWMMDFLGGRPPLGPKSLRNSERALASLAGTGVGKAMAMDIATTIATYVLGAVLREVQEANGDDYFRTQYAHLSDDERHQMLHDFAGRLRDSGRYPNLSALIESGVDPDSPDTRDERFGLGLECLLDGIAARIPAATPGAAPPGPPPPPAGETPSGPAAQPPPGPPQRLAAVYHNPSLPVAARRPSPTHRGKDAAPGTEGS